MDWINEHKPAFIGADGSKKWHVYGVLHCAGDKPAVIGADGSCEWFVYGRRHRGKNRPAVLLTDGCCNFWEHNTFCGCKQVTDFTTTSRRSVFVAVIMR